MYGKYRISSDPENVSTETLHDVQRPLSAVVKHAIIVIVAHATEVGDPIDSTGKPKEYPKTLEECVRMQLDLLEESLYSNVEIDNTHSYNIVDQGHQSFSSYDHTVITSRIMKSVVLNALIQHFSNKINADIAAKSKEKKIGIHNPAVMEYNKIILSQFFGNYFKDFKQMFMNETIRLIDKGQLTSYLDFNKRDGLKSHPSCYMQEHKTINSRVVFSETPSNLLTLNELKTRSFDAFSAIFLSYTDGFDITTKCDITLTDTWITFGVYDVIVKYIQEWNEYCMDHHNMARRIILTPKKIKEMNVINIYHLVFLILDKANAGENLRQMSIPYLIEHMCTSFTLKLYINSFTCRSSAQCTSAFLKQSSEGRSLRRTLTRDNCSDIPSETRSMKKEVVGIMNKTVEDLLLVRDRASNSDSSGKDRASNSDSSGKDRASNSDSSGKDDILATEWIEHVIQTIQPPLGEIDYIHTIQSCSEPEPEPKPKHKIRSKRKSDGVGKKTNRRQKEDKNKTKRRQKYIQANIKKQKNTSQK